MRLLTLKVPSFFGDFKISRQPYVVFSKKLNDNMTVAALSGTYASNGGAPAAAIVFPREVSKRAANDPRVRGS